MTDPLDSIVKGAPLIPGGGHALSKAVGTTPISPSEDMDKSGDPLIHTPSSPSMIYLNLLVLEASLRAQYLELRARKRHHAFFLGILAIWNVGFAYALFLAPREDGRGVGGSVYWVLETMERLCFLGGVVTTVLVWATGIWERGIRWPSRWFTMSNRGLRGFNCKLVRLKRPWWKEWLSTIGWFLTYGLFSQHAGSSYRHVDAAVLREVDREMNLTSQNHPVLHVTNWDEEKAGHEEDLSPGGDYIKLLLLPKPFSPPFRENWEQYRNAYWERENDRRALLRAKLKERDHRLRREHGGWLWWLPWRQVPTPEKPHSGRGELEKAHHPRHSAVVAEHRRTRSGSMRRGSFSTGGGVSRSTTPTLEVDEAVGGVTRKASTSSNASDKKRKKLGSATKTRPRVESRSVTPENPSPLARDASPGSRTLKPPAEVPVAATSSREA